MKIINFLKNIGKYTKFFYVDLYKKALNDFIYSDMLYIFKALLIIPIYLICTLTFILLSLILIPILALLRA
jgi:hypothetical protein